MATSDFHEQILTCSICAMNFRDPKVLPCLHTFCKDCLHDLAAKKQPLECPTCRTEVSLPDQGVDGLKSNFSVNNMLDFEAAKKGAEPGVPCQVCEGGLDQTKSWCADCGMLLCEFCTSTHPKVPATKDHELVPQDVMKAKEGVDRFQRKRHCSKHKNHELILYCESCNALICTACIEADHRPGKDHNPVREIATVAQEKRKTLQGLLQQIGQRLKEIQASVKDVERKISNLTPSKEAATNQAKAYFRQIVNQLQKRELEILSQIDDQCRADDKALETQKKAIELELVGLTSTQTFCQQAVEHGSDVHVLEVGNQVQTRVKTLLTKELDLESYWSEFQFVENTAVTDFEKDVKDFGGLKTNVDVSKCNVAVEPTVQGFQCKAKLMTMNKEGCPCVTNSKAITVEVNDPSGKNVPTQVQMMNKGVWEISYVPKVTGNHEFEVKVNSQHVAGSPFDVEVQVREKPVLTIGRKGSGAGELDRPLGVVVDKDGNIVVVEHGNKRIQIFDADTGHSLSSFQVDGTPYGVDVDSNGRLLVALVMRNDGLRCYSKEGELVCTFEPDASLHNPRGVTVLQDGRMVVADNKQKCCLLLQPDGSLIRDIGKGRLQDPRFIAVDESRDVMFVTDYEAGKIFAFDLDGKLMLDFGKQGKNDGELNNPNGIALDPERNIIVGNGGDGRVQVFGPDGTFLRTVATVKGKKAGGLALTPDGYLAVACQSGHCVELYRYM